MSTNRPDPEAEHSLTSIEPSEETLARRRARSERQRQEDAGVAVGSLVLLLVVGFVVYKVGRFVSGAVYETYFARDDAISREYTDQRLRLARIQSELDDLSLYMMEQEQEMLSRQLDIKELGDRYQQLRTLSDIQQRHVDSILREQTRAATFGHVISFIGGIMSSLIASWLFRLIENRRDGPAAAT